MLIRDRIEFNHDAPLALLMKPDEDDCMSGFLIRVLSLEQHRRRQFRITVIGADRFKAKRVYKEETVQQ